MSLNVRKRRIIYIFIWQRTRFTLRPRVSAKISMAKSRSCRKCVGNYWKEWRKVSDGCCTCIVLKWTNGDDVNHHARRRWQQSFISGLAFSVRCRIESTSASLCGQWSINPQTRRDAFLNLFRVWSNLNFDSECDYATLSWKRAELIDLNFLSGFFFTRMKAAAKAARATTLAALKNAWAKWTKTSFVIQWNERKYLQEPVARFPALNAKTKVLKK